MSASTSPSSSRLASSAVRAAAAGQTATTVRVQGGRDAAHRWSLHGREGAPRRFLARRGRRSRRCARTSPRASRPRAWAARSRCGRWWRGNAARAGLPRRVGARPREPRRLPRRLRSRRGRRAGGVRDRRPALAPGRAAGQPGRLADDHRPQPRDRPPAPRPDDRREDTPARRARGRGGRDGGDDLSRRAARADLHLLPSGARARGAGRAHPARARRSDDGGDRPRLPRSRGDDETAARTREAEDQSCGNPVSRPADTPAARAAGRGARRRLPGLQRGLLRRHRPRRRGDPAHSPTGG